MLDNYIRLFYILCFYFKTSKFQSYELYSSQCHGLCAGSQEKKQSAEVMEAEVNLTEPQLYC